MQHPSALPMAQTLTSSMDDSVNFVRTGDFAGAVEARYVRRCADELIIYLSSQTGCNQACRFCHLTQTGQTQGVDVSVDGYVDQAREVLAHYAALVASGHPAARVANLNFMSRGEVFANAHVLADGSGLIDALAREVLEHDLTPRMKFSTIMPRTLAGVELAALFPRHQPDLYLSLYSMDPQWRRRWMPKALPAEEALAMLAAYAHTTRKVPVVHFALIAGENDSEASVAGVARGILDAGLRCDVNIVRYNPFSPAHGAEPAEAVLHARAQQLADALPFSRVQLVGRVGHDVKASCGMFVAGAGARGAEMLAAQAPVASSPSTYFAAGLDRAAPEGTVCP